MIVRESLNKEKDSDVLNLSLGRTIMETTIKEYLFYKNFNELTTDIMALAKEIFPDSFLFLSIFINNEQHVLKTSENTEPIHIETGMYLPLSHAICNRIDFIKGTPLIFEDLSKESCLDDIKSTFLKANINAYLGVPVILRDGQVFGTLCAVHKKAMTFSANSIRLIEKIAKMFSYYLELERMAYRDQLTGCFNRHFLELYFNEFAENGGLIFYLDLDGFKQINDILGHDKGDLVLKEVSIRLDEIMQQRNLNGNVFRLGGDEFIINLVGIISKKEIEEIAIALITKLSSWKFHIKDFRLSVSIGIASYMNNKRTTLNELLRKADHALYTAKTGGKDTYRYFDE